MFGGVPVIDAGGAGGMMQKKIRTKVFGVSHHNRQEIIRKQIRPGQQLLLIREPGNPIDRNAIGVWVEVKKLLRRKRYQLGYLSEERAQLIAPVLDVGWPYTAVVDKVTGGSREKPTRGINIYIELEEPG